MARPEQVLLLEPQHELKFRGKRGGPGCGREEEWGTWLCQRCLEGEGGTIREPIPSGAAVHIFTI